MAKKPIPASLVQVNSLTSDINEFVFELENPIDFVAGQYLMIRKLSSPDKKAYSMVSYDAQSQKVSFCIKKQGHFTQALFASRVGEKFECSGPFGRFTLAKERRPVVFIAGGIGITPIYAMIKELKKTGRLKKACLFYSARTKKEMIFKEEIKELFENPQDCEFFFTHEGDPRISYELIRGRLSESHPFIYICGPQKMIESLCVQCEKNHVDAEQIRLEHFK